VTWQENMLARVHAVQDPPPAIRVRRRERRDGAGYASAFGRTLFRVHLHTSVEMVGLIDRAARVRGVNRSTLIRRAVALVVADALAMDIRDVLYHSPGHGAYGAHQTDRGSRDDGAGIETWCPHPGCDGSHLREP